MDNSNNFCSDVSEFNVLRGLTGSHNAVGFFHLNVQRACSLRKFDMITDYLLSFHERPTVIGLSETWFMQNETGESNALKRPFRMYELEGYESVFVQGMKGVGE